MFNRAKLKSLEAAIWSLQEHGRVLHEEIRALREAHVAKCTATNADIMRAERVTDFHSEKLDDVYRHLDTQTEQSAALIESVKILTQIFTSLITEGRVEVSTPRKSKRRKR